MKTGEITGGISITKDTLNYDVIEAFLSSSINAIEKCRSDIINSLDQLDTQFNHYYRAIQEEKERAKRGE